MESTRTHPLLIVAAVSLTAFSAVGIAALTGLLPASKGANDVLEAPKDISKAAEPVASPPIAAAPAVAAPAEPLPKEKPIAVRKHKPSAPIVYKEFADAPKVAQAAPLPPAPMAQTPAPAPIPGVAGVVESVREVTQPGQGNGLGAAAGGLLGGVFGNKLGNNSHRGLWTVLGAAGGALAGHTIQKDATAAKHWEVTVRLDDGSSKTLTSDAAPFWHAGDRVRYLDGRLQPV